MKINFRLRNHLKLRHKIDVDDLTPLPIVTHSMNAYEEIEIYETEHAVENMIEKENVTDVTEEYEILDVA